MGLLDNMGSASAWNPLSHTFDSVDSAAEATFGAVLKPKSECRFANFHGLIVSFSFSENSGEQLESGARSLS